MFLTPDLPYSYGSGGKLPAIDAFVLDTFDRSAPNGTGHTKLGGE